MPQENFCQAAQRMHQNFENIPNEIQQHFVFKGAVYCSGPRQKIRNIGQGLQNSFFIVDPLFPFL